MREHGVYKTVATTRKRHLVPDLVAAKKGNCCLTLSRLGRVRTIRHAVGHKMETVLVMTTSVGRKRHYR